MFEALEALPPDQINRDMGNSFKSIRDTVTHMYAAEWVWYSRWQGTSPTALLTTDTFADLAALRSAWIEQERKIRTFVEELGDAGMPRVFAYTMFNGQSSGSPFWQMLQHVVNHGSYHRGQVTTMLRQLGAQPPQPLDMIAFYRSQGPAAGV